MDEPSEDILGCGDISEEKSNWLLEQAGDLIPEDPVRRFLIMENDSLKRQLKEEYVLDEMEISENGPNLPNADKLLAAAMHKYWQSKANSLDSSWHFCHKSDDVRTYSNRSKVIEKLIKIKPKFPFMNT